jgi:hypothetical protein
LNLLDRGTAFLVPKFKEPCRGYTDRAGNGPKNSEFGPLFSSLNLTEIPDGYSRPFSYDGPRKLLRLPSGLDVLTELTMFFNFVDFVVVRMHEQRIRYSSDITVGIGYEPIIFLALWAYSLYI